MNLYAWPDGLHVLFAFVFCFAQWGLLLLYSYGS
jgi:hypothetical protein